MRKRISIVVAGCGLIAVVIVSFYLKVGGLVFGREDPDSARVGYCFDVSTDDTGRRLFVAAADRGLHVFDLAWGRPRYVNTYYEGGYFRSLKVSNDRAYVADARRGLVILDIGSEPPVATSVQSSITAAGLYVGEDLVFVAAFEQGLQILDISDPDSPVLLSSLVTPGSAWDVWVHDGFAYVAGLNAGLSVVDITSPSEPLYVTTVTWARRHQSAETVRGEGSIVYVAAADHGLVIVDVSDPLRPVVASRYRPIRVGAAEGLAVRDGIVYLAMGSQIELERPGSNLQIATTTENGLHIIDTTDPYRPSLLGKISFLGWVEGVHIAGDYAYIANTGNGLRSIDVREPSEPVIIDSWNRVPETRTGREFGGLSLPIYSRPDGRLCCPVKN